MSRNRYGESCFKCNSRNTWIYQAFVWVFILGPGLLITCIPMFVLSTKTTPIHHNVTLYNRAVDKWVGGEYDSFVALNLSFGIYTAGTTDINTMNISDIADPLNDNKKTIHLYNQYYKFEYTGNVGTGQNSGASISLINNVTGVSITEAVGEVVIRTNTTAYDMYCSYDADECVEKCNKKNGYYSLNTSVCYYQQVLLEVGIKVQEDGSFLLSGDNLAYKIYSDNQPGNATFDGTNPPFQVTVRSINDPFLALLDLSGGTLKLPSKMNIFLILGIVFVVVGTLVTLLVICIVCCMCDYEIKRFFNRDKTQV